MSLTINVKERRAGSYMVTLKGRLDSLTAGSLEEKIKPLFAPGTKVIIIDVAELDYISSMGLRVMLEARKALKAHKGHILIANMQPQVAQVFKVADILPKTDVFNSVESADIYLDAIQRKETVKGMDVDD